MRFATTCRRRRMVLVLLLGLGLTAGALLPARPVAAATITVTTTGDNPDFIPEDGVCDTSPGPGTPCSLRAALQTANASPGRDTIRFNIPGGGVKTIRPGDALPDITEQVSIDGYTQPGARANTNTATTGTNAVLLIELDGSDAPGSGLQLRNGNNTLIRGLVINRWQSAIRIEPEAPGTRIVGCFLGTDAAGTASLGNTTGILAAAPSLQIGGSDPAARNLVSGNFGEGIRLGFRARDTRVLGNLIGTTRSGAGDLGNVRTGLLSGAENVTIGGFPPNHPNTIAFNGGDGVAVVSNTALRNAILVNSIFANDGIGINLGFDVRTPNDPRDPDDGPNNFQNFPVILNATSNGVIGSLNSTPNSTFTIRLFSNPGTGDEGRFFEDGPVTVTTNEFGNASFTFEPDPPIPAGRSVTATATDANGNTSEFSDPAPVAAP